MRVSCFLAFALLTPVIAAADAADAAAAAPGFETRADLAAWDVIDFQGDGAAAPVTDPSTPPPYGPTVLHVQGGHMLLLAKGVRRQAGTITVLYRELAPQDRDADGVLAFGGAYPDDVREIHNTKDVRPYTWFEMDNDSGIHFRAKRGGGEETVDAQKPGEGLVTDSWNKTNWIWQKVRIGGGHVRAKYWPAHKPEPAAWNIEAPWDRQAPRRVGVRVGSGDIHLAYFAADDQDIPIAPPAAWLHAACEQVPGPANLELTLYVNDPPDKAVPLRIRVYRGKELLQEFEKEHTFIGTPATLDVVRWVERAMDKPFLPADAAAGDYTVTAVAASGAIDARAPFTLLSTEALEAHLDAAEQAAQQVASSNRENAGMAQSVVDLVAHAHEMLAKGDVHAAEQARDYALQPLRALTARGAAVWPEALAGQREPAAVPPAADSGKRVFYRPGLALRVSGIDLHGAGTFVAGQSYRISVALENLGGIGVPLEAELMLRSPLGTRTIARDTVTIGSGAAGSVTIDFTLELPRPEDAKLEPQPNILTEPHHLLLQVRNAENSAYVLLDMPPGPQQDRPGQHFLLDDIYVTTHWPAIGAVSPAQGRIGEAITIETRLRSKGRPMKAAVLLELRTAGGTLIHREVKTAAISPQQAAPVTFNWTPDTAGNLQRAIEVREGPRLLTRTADTLAIAPPAPVTVTHANRCEPAGDNAYTTPVAVTSTDAAPHSVRIYDDTGELAGTRDRAGTVACRPHYGYYDVVADFGGWRYTERIVAQVSRVRGGVLTLNGEPFIIKGLNVHSLDARSPARTRLMMQIFKARGFNMLRGDFPPSWQIDMALEENLAYTVLAPFSVCATDDVFARQDGPPLATAQRITALFIDRYVDQAGALFWNSSNEVIGDTTPFLRALYPLYKAMDPAQRPVHYANLYGQDRWQGQDFMSVNYYFSAQEDSRQRHPNIARSLDIAQEHGVPLTYCEFNSWHGAVIPSGVDALYGMFQWGLAKGMQGGFYYFRFNSKRHPGIIDNDYNTHKLIDDALRDVFADAEVTVEAVQPGGLRLAVRNKRSFTLRDAALTAAIGDGRTYNVALDDVGPHADAVAEVVLEGGAPATGMLVEGALTFTTHYAFHETVPFTFAVR
ncbi:MAG: hypothetical protein ACLFTT_17915 [Candidatus Hydrogenedentota bacterium]